MLCFLTGTVDIFRAGPLRVKSRAVASATSLSAHHKALYAPIALMDASHYFALQDTNQESSCPEGSTRGYHENVKGNGGGIGSRVTHLLHHKLVCTSVKNVPCWKAWNHFLLHWGSRDMQEV